MAKHATHKNTPDGRRVTAQRKNKRAAKYRTPALDLDRLTAELHREQAAMDRANSTTLYR